MAKTRKQLKQINLELAQRLASMDGRSKKQLQARIAELEAMVKEVNACNADVSKALARQIEDNKFLHNTIETMKREQSTQKEAA